MDGGGIAPAGRGEILATAFWIIYAVVQGKDIKLQLVQYKRFQIPFPKERKKEKLLVGKEDRVVARKNERRRHVSPPRADLAGTLRRYCFPILLKSGKWRWRPPPASSLTVAVAKLFWGGREEAVRFLAPCTATAGAFPSTLLLMGNWPAGARRRNIFCIEADTRQQSTLGDYSLAWRSTDGPQNTNIPTSFPVHYYMFFSFFLFGLLRASFYIYATFCVCVCVWKGLTLRISDKCPSMIFRNRTSAAAEPETKLPFDIKTQRSLRLISHWSWLLLLLCWWTGVGFFKRENVGGVVGPAAAAMTKGIVASVD